MNVFRKVNIPRLAGKLFLSHMPGMRGEPLDEFLVEAREIGISQIVCLPSGEEVEQYAPAYHHAIIAEELPATVHRMDIVDGRAPTDDEAYMTRVVEVAQALKKGRAILVHCLGGIGRTGTFAVAVLLQLGHDLNDALDLVADAGAWPQSGEQLTWLERRRQG